MASNDNNNRNRDKHLFYLNELSDYKVSSDDPDVRGWKVKDVDQRVIGKVDNLLVNKNTERVVYLDVEVDKSILEANHDPYGSSASKGVHEFVNKDGEEHLIIPIGLVKLNEDDKFIYTEKVNHRTFAETKRMKKGANIDREYEEVVLASYNRDTNSSSDRNKSSRETAATGDRNKTSGDKAVTGDRDKASRENAVTGDRNKTSGDKKAVTSERYKDADREIELPKDSDTKTREHQGTDRGASNVSNKRSDNVQNRKSGEKNEELASFDDKKTSFSSDKGKDSSTRTSQSKSDATSQRKREHTDNDEDFYNKKEFDDKNFRKRK